MTTSKLANLIQLARQNLTDAELAALAGCLLARVDLDLHFGSFWEQMEAMDQAVLELLISRTELQDAT